MDPYHHTITCNNKRYKYTIKPIGKKWAHFKCDGAGINQRFLVEDIPALLTDLPHLIASEKVYLEGQKQVIRFRVSPDDKKKIEQRAAKAGYPTVSAFLRDLAVGK